MKHRCPICHKTFQSSGQEPFEKADFFPFCSQKCKLIDLGSWLDARYKVVSSLQSQESDVSSETPISNPGVQ
jgi:endogenous inhibitor of DNA gyrase (YacG/DUF329 family)